MPVRGREQVDPRLWPRGRRLVLIKRLSSNPNGAGCQNSDSALEHASALAENLVRDARVCQGRQGRLLLPKRAEVQDEVRVWGVKNRFARGETVILRAKREF
jgi:hypothetical protein